MKLFIFLLITLTAGVCYGQLPVTSDNILVLVSGSAKCTLSREAEQYFNRDNVRAHMKTLKFQYVHYYGDQIGKDYHKKWGITHYPSVVHLKKVDGKWYRARLFNPTKTKMSYVNVLKFIGVKVEYAEPKQQYVQPQPPAYSIPFQGNSGST